MGEKGISKTTKIQSLITEAEPNSTIANSSVLDEVIPGNIRRGEHFLAFLKRLVMFLKNIMKTKEIRKFSPLTFLNEIQNLTGIDSRSLKMASQRLKLLFNTLQILETDEFNFQFK